MSRMYDMDVEIWDFKRDRTLQVEEAACKEWPGLKGNLQDLSAAQGTYMMGDGQGNLTNGRTEQEFAQAFAEAVWKANKGFCGVKINATCIEDLPFETYEFGEGDYQRFCDAGLPLEEEEEEVDE